MLTAGQQRSVLMTREDLQSPIVLIVEDVHETRDGIEKLLMADGYRVALARDESDAIESAQRTLPDLILVSLAGTAREVVLSARRIRERADVNEGVPVIVFCIEGIDQGDEIEISENVHITRPDNFNQLRTLIARLLNNRVSLAA